MAKMKKDDAAWWRGMRMKVTDVYGTTYTYESVDALIEDPDWVSRDGETKGKKVPAYIVTSNLADAKWDEEFGFWYMPGATKGELPTILVTEGEDAQGVAEVVTEIVDPPIPTCICVEPGHAHGDEVCGTITWMAGPRCNTCRVADAAMGAA